MGDSLDLLLLTGHIVLLLWLQQPWTRRLIGNAAGLLSPLL